MKKRTVGSRFALAALMPMLISAWAGAQAPVEDPKAGGSPEPAAAPGSTAAAKDGAAPAPGAPATSIAQARRDALIAEMQPPDGNWLLDEQGRSYFIRLQPKTLPYKLLPDSRVRIVYGAEFDLAGQDDENLWLKIYRLGEKLTVHSPAIQKPTAEQLAASAATFVTAIGTSDRLNLKRFDAGLPTAGAWRNGFDIADVDGDGNLDFVHGPPRRGGDQPRIFLGDGHGNWHSWKASVPPNLIDYGDVKVADFNGDGKADLAFAVHLRGIAVFVGDGKGNFSPWGKGLDFDSPRPGFDASGFSSRTLSVIDWNKDGRPDLVALSEGPKISIQGTTKAPKVTGVDSGNEAFGPKVYLNNGDGSWTSVKEVSARNEIFGGDLAVGDFDGNGSMDFLIGSNAMGRKDLMYLQGKKAGGPWTVVDLPVRPRSYVDAVAVGDFNKDRKVDFALSYTNFELGVNR
ncbi:MAG: VCBS repeat-containing protein, partial [Thermoanaerobaculia bacterium]